VSRRDRPARRELHVDCSDRTPVEEQCVTHAVGVRQVFRSALVLPNGLHVVRPRCLALDAQPERQHRAITCAHTSQRFDRPFTVVPHDRLRDPTKKGRVDNVVSAHTRHPHPMSTESDSESCPGRAEQPRMRNQRIRAGCRTWRYSCDLSAGHSTRDRNATRRDGRALPMVRDRAPPHGSRR